MLWTGTLVKKPPSPYSIVVFTHVAPWGLYCKKSVKQTLYTQGHTLDFRSSLHRKMVLAQCFIYNILNDTGYEYDKVKVHGSRRLPASSDCLRSEYYTQRPQSSFIVHRVRDVPKLEPLFLLSYSRVGEGFSNGRRGIWLTASMIYIRPWGKKL